MLLYLYRDLSLKELQEILKLFSYMTKENIHDILSRFIFIVLDLDNFIN